MVTTLADASTTGGDDAKKEKITHANMMMAPSRHTPVYDLIKLIPTCCVGSPAKAASGTGAIAVYM